MRQMKGITTKMIIGIIFAILLGILAIMIVTKTDELNCIFSIVYMSIKNIIPNVI